MNDCKHRWTTLRPEVVRLLKIGRVNPLSGHASHVTSISSPRCIKCGEKTTFEQMQRDVAFTQRMHKIVDCIILALGIVVLRLVSMQLAGGGFIEWFLASSIATFSLLLAWIYSRPS